MAIQPPADSPAPMPVTQEFETTYLSDLDNAIRRYKRQADRPMVYFIVLRVALVVASASLPALTTFSDRSWSTLVAILVAALAGLDTQFRWGDEWQHFRSTQLASERLKRAYHRREAALENLSEADCKKAHSENFNLLFTEFEALLQSEAERFFSFRITKWQSGERTS